MACFPCMKKKKSLERRTKLPWQEQPQISEGSGTSERKKLKGSESEEESKKESEEESKKESKKESEEESEEESKKESEEESKEESLGSSEGAEEKKEGKQVSFAENLCTFHEIPQWKKKESKFIRFFRRIFRRKSKRSGIKDESGHRTDIMASGSTNRSIAHFAENLCTYNDGTRQWKNTMLDHDEDQLMCD
eukprot:XP_012822739.1 PREDICTED: X-linked retinitis pigmentosa GTPase regulator-interacting protein 1-like [Xenopus tropicalis]